MSGLLSIFNTGANSLLAQTARSSGDGLKPRERGHPGLKAASDLTIQQLALQAAAQSASRVLQTSLLDFLK